MCSAPPVENIGRSRARTENIESDKLDFFVEEFFCRDHTAMRSLAAHDKVIRWQIRVVGIEGQHLHPTPAVGAPPPPDEDEGPRPAVCQTKAIEVHIKTHNVRRSEVSVIVDNESIFPGPEFSRPMARMRGDFSYSWKFRGMVPGLHHSGIFELDIGNMFDGPEAESRWIDCVILDQRADGLFEVSAIDPSRPKEHIMYPGIRAELMRFKDGGKPLEIPEHVLAIEVPKGDPLRTTLLVDDKPMTHYLGRGSPKGMAGGFGGPTPPVNIFVEKDRKSCTIDAGHTLLSHFLSNEVMAGTCTPERRKKTWVLKVGPFAEHVIQIERKYKMVGVSSIVTLSVDGTTMVESNSEDVDSDPLVAKWQASFKFFGERFIVWDVPETDRHGHVLETRGFLRQPFRFTNTIEVRITDSRNFFSADLFVDQKNFNDLRLVLAPHDEHPSLKMNADVMFAQYKLKVPSKEKWEPARMIDHLGVAAAPVAAQATLAAGNAAGFLQARLGEMLSGQAAARGAVELEEGEVPQAPGPLGIMSVRFAEMFGGAAVSAPPYDGPDDDEPAAAPAAAPEAVPGAAPAALPSAPPAQSAMSI